MKKWKNEKMKKWKINNENGSKTKLIESKVTKKQK